MEHWGMLNLYIHIAAGSLTLLAGPVAIFYNGDNVKLHKLWGKLFLGAMTVVNVSALLGFIQHPTQVIYQFFAGIAILVAFNLYKGIRAMQMKRQPTIKTLDKAIFLITALVGLFFLSMAIYGFRYLNGGPVFILFSVFGLALVLDLVTLLRLVNNADTTSIQWFKQHISGMLAAFTASTTAFMVNVDIGLPWYVAWFGPTVVIQPLLFYFFKKYRLNVKKEMAV